MCANRESKNTFAVHFALSQFSHFALLYMRVEHVKNRDYIHHRPPSVAGAVLSEIVFGMEDGMVSTLGAITGIAAGTRSHFTVVLSGLVIVAVESISMAVGSYLSSKSEKEVEERKIFEESLEIKSAPEKEKVELVEFYCKDGWPENLAGQMADFASKNEALFLKEMSCRELKIIPGNSSDPLRNGIAMGFSYILGGAIPLFPYFFISSFDRALPVSVFITLVGLFLLGFYTSRFSKRAWWKAGIEMLGLAAAAAVIGYGVGMVAESFIVTF